MDIGDDVWTSDRQEVVVAFEFDRMVGESIVSEVGLVKALVLNACSHRAVEYEHTLGEMLAQRLKTHGAIGHDAWLSACGVEMVGLIPRMRQVAAVRFGLFIV